MWNTMLRAAVAGALAAGVLGGCRDTDRSASLGPDSSIGLKLEQTTRSIVAGEIVTVTARTENLLGRDASIRWLAPGGDLQTEQNGRTARVRYDQPGTYTITAQLFADEREVRRDQVTVRVNPLP
ncbi:MAG: hypothetical protein WD749_10275 [Phycisphaerales bacterium]